MISLFVTYCMILNPSMCRVLEVVPIDHEIVSVPECLRGGAIGSMRFVIDHAEWQVKGWRCTEKPTLIEQWAAQTH